MRRRALVAALALGTTSCAGGLPPSHWRVETVIVHASKALPSGLEATLARLAGVRWTRAATSAMVDLVRVDGGKQLPRRPMSSILPFEIGAANPLPGATDSVSEALARGEAALSNSSAAFRGLHYGGTFTIRLGSRRATFRVGAIADDNRTTDVEALVPLRAARALGVDTSREVIAGVRGDALRVFTRRARAGAAPVPVRIGDSNAVATPDGGRLLSLAEVKWRFGEFTFVPVPNSRWLQPDPVWVARNIAWTTLPVLGSIRCNVRIAGPLAGAMREVQAAGLAALVREKSSCYAPRMQVLDPTVISRHSWGIAVDINPSANRFGQPPTQDERLVAIMRRWGFSWGGVWLVPDGMHFEFAPGE